MLIFCFSMIQTKFQHRGKSSSSFYYNTQKCPSKIPKHFTACLATLIPSRFSNRSFRFPNSMHSVFDRFIFDPANLQNLSMVLIAWFIDSISPYITVISAARCTFFFISSCKFFEVNPCIKLFSLILLD